MLGWLSEAANESCMRGIHLPEAHLEMIVFKLHSSVLQADEQRMKPLDLTRMFALREACRLDKLSAVCNICFSY